MPADQETSVMLRTVQFGCTLSKPEADTLNAESGRLYTDMLVCHYRISRHKGIWLRPEQGERWEDRHGGLSILHAHSRDAAQQGCSTACKTAQACQQAGLATKYPSHRKRWRTTVWKASGIRRQDGTLRLARARGLEHKVRRAVVHWAAARHAARLVIGDVRDVADGKRLHTQAQQKIGVWSHGRQRAYMTYKAEAAGSTVLLVDEAYASQTCPGPLPDGTACLHCSTPRGGAMSVLCVGLRRTAMRWVRPSA